MAAIVRDSGSVFDAIVHAAFLETDVNCKLRLVEAYYRPKMVHCVTLPIRKHQLISTILDVHGLSEQTLQKY